MAPNTKTITLTLSHVSYPEEGASRGWIKGTDNTIIGVFEDKIGMFQKGKTYDIEYTEANANGKTYKNFKSAVPVETGRAQSASSSTSSSSTHVPEGGASKDEQIFVMCGLKELIRAGLVNDNQQAIIRTILMLRGAFRAGFLDAGNTFTQSEAGRAARR